MDQLPRQADMDPLAGRDDDDAQRVVRAELFDLEGLARGEYGLTDVLERVAAFAVEAVPGADGAGVTLLTTDQPHRPIEMFGASNELVAEIERIQYEMVHEGPCITAMQERRAVRSGSLGGEKQWPRFGPRVSRLGVHSTLALPLLLPTRVVGAINIYARAKNAFSDDAVALGVQFAQPAAVAVQNALHLSRALGVAGQLQQALESRRVIDQAIGLVMARRGCSAQEAFDQLRMISQRENRKLSRVAADLVEDATPRTRRSPPRHSAEPPPTAQRRPDLNA